MASQPKAAQVLTLLLSIIAAIGVLYGVATLLTPVAYLHLLGVSANSSAVLQARYFGAAVLGAGVMLGTARQAQELVVPRTLSRGKLLAAAGSAIVTAGPVHRPDQRCGLGILGLRTAAGSRLRPCLCAAPALLSCVNRAG